jgi:hypothetical protein
MPSLFPHLSAAEPRELADRIIQLPDNERRELVNQLGGLIEKVSAAEAVQERKKVAMERINACKADVAGGRATINLLNGNLRRGGMPPVEDLVEKSPDEIMKLFAASSMASIHKISCKSTLSKLKVIP